MADDDTKTKLITPEAEVEDGGDELFSPDALDEVLLDDAVLEEEEAGLEDVAVVAEEEDDDYANDGYDDDF